MKGFEQLSHKEIQSIYEDAKQLVSTWQDSRNASIGLAPFGQCIIGPDHYIMEITGIGSGFDNLTQVCDAIRRFYPGATLAEEPLPNGSRRYYINVPILVPESQYTKSGKRVVHSKSPQKPSTEWLMFLVMIESVSGVILYFRLLQ